MLFRSYKANGITSVEQAKKFIPQSTSQSKPREKDFDERTYSQEELQSVITSIDSLKDIEW